MVIGRNAKLGGVSLPLCRHQSPQPINLVTLNLNVPESSNSKQTFTLTPPIRFEVSAAEDSQKIITETTSNIIVAPVGDHNFATRLEDASSFG